MNQQINDSVYNRALGCLIGALIGDSFGGRYEFSDGKYDQELEASQNYRNKNGAFFREYVPIQGGGCWNLCKGQITDDGELTLTLGDALIGAHCVDLETIARAYRGWYESEPFDIGNTTKNSFSQLNTYEMLKKSKELDDMFIKIHSDHCMSNGMLMRISPLGILVAGMLLKNNALTGDDYLKIKTMVKTDTYLTHHSEEALMYSTMYVILMAHCIVYGDMDLGIKFLIECQDPKIGDWKTILTAGLNPDAMLAHDPKVMIGDSRIALQLAIRKALLVSRFTNQNEGFDVMDNSRIMDFTEAIVSTVKLGGDTDTNACIVGALCGAIVGIDVIPDHWIQSINNVKNCDRYQQYKINQWTNNLNLFVSRILSIGLSD